MQASEAALTLIKKWEGLALDPYICPAGKWTVGWGHVIAEPKGRISLNDAEHLLRTDLVKFEKAVSKLIGMEPTQQRHFDAFVSFAFNCGPDALEKSTLFRVHKSGQRLPTERTYAEFTELAKMKTLPQNAPDQFLAWSYGGGRWLKGLFNRRWDERTMYLGR